MSEDQLYQIAQKRVDKRNRRWLLWGVNFLGWMSWIAFAAAFSDQIQPQGLAPMVAIIWMGIVVLHGIAIGMAQNRDHQVEREVSRLRHEIYDEKPKRQASRLQLNEDGELIDASDSPDEYSAQRVRHD